MWVFTKDAALSIVAHTGRPGHLLIRSRVRGDIQKVIEEATVFETPGADYRYRAIVPKDAMAVALSDAALNIGYPNFKDSVATKDKPRKAAYLAVWQAMAQVFGAYGSGRPSVEYGAVYVARRASGCRVTLWGVSPRQAVMEAYWKFQLCTPDLPEGAESLEDAFGHLVTQSDEEAATLGAWVATIYERDLVGFPRQTIQEAIAEGRTLTIGERWQIDGILLSEGRQSFEEELD